MGQRWLQNRIIVRPAQRTPRGPNNLPPLFRQKIGGGWEFQVAAYPAPPFQRPHNCAGGCHCFAVEWMKFVDFAAVQGAMDFQGCPVGNGAEKVGSLRRQPR
ncbi:MAG: hypothetical protein DYG89_54725 [Caldilinea sp. CFX5]|nr:hypothetical protein [Caldilinea sp. CFX5]